MIGVSARSGSRCRAAVAAGVVVLTMWGALLAPQVAVPASPTASGSKTRTCKSFTYKHKHVGVTYRFYRLRITGAKCKSIKRVVYGYFQDRGAPAGSVPTDGYNVFGWNVLIHTNTLDGRKGKAHFTGVYGI